MNIEQEIQDLLYRNNCVIIPEFGAFVSTQIGSQLIDNHSFIPPKKQLSFNSQIVNNDGLLVNYIAQSKAISYDEALDIVKEVVKNWQDKLKLIQKLYLKNIGNFTQSDFGILIFTPEENVNFLTTSFGLASFVSPNVERNNENTPIVENTIIETKIEKLVPKTKEKKSNSFWKIAAILLLFLTLSTFISIIHYNYTIDKQRELAENKVNEKINQKISEATFALPVLEFKDFKENTNYNQYYVIAGSFSKEINAEKLKSELNTKGYSSTIIARENKMFTVTYQGFNSEIEAENYRKNIQKTSNQDAWVLQVNQ